MAITILKNKGKLIPLTFIFLSVFISAFASIDHAKSDSLNTLLGKLSADTSKVDKLNALAFELRDNDRNKAFVYAAEAETLAIKLDYE